MRVGFNIAMVCVVALICIAAVAITALALGINGTVTMLAFTALGAIPASIITWLVKSKTEAKKE